MGTLGVQEMLVIFLVALVLFGPKKLPELGRTIGKALTEFRRASNDLKATFDREMQALERETNELKDTTHQIAGEIRSHVNFENLNPFDAIAESEPSSLPANHGELLLPAHDPSHDGTTVGASEVPGAESHGNTAQAATESQPTAHPGAQAGPAIEGTVPRAPNGAAHTEPGAAPVVTAGDAAHAHAPSGHAEAEVPQHS